MNPPVLRLTLTRLAQDLQTVHIVGMQGLKRVPGSPCPSFVPTTGWRCLQILVDGRVLDRGNMPPKLTSDYTNDLPGAVAAWPQVLAPGVLDALRAQI